MATGVAIQPMTEHAAERARELSALGFDIRRLGFIRWLIQHGQNPEWCGQELAETPAGF